jgi:peptide-methionine (S)-S-oxide reductase
MAPRAESLGQGGKKMEKALFGAGCFWGVEETFRTTEGVVDTKVGYAGGHVEKPMYRQVCTDKTGHAEVCLVTFDPEKISYEKLLGVFWSCHNPTQVNRQGPDYGKQYRSVIFTYSDEQKATAEKSKAALAESGKYDRPIATAIETAPTFWPAEEYHQRYYEKKGGGACPAP